MPLTPLRLRLLVVSLLTVSLLGALDHTIVSTSLATVAGELGALEQMSWIVVGYTLASTVLLPVLGKLGDMVGPALDLPHVAHRVPGGIARLRVRAGHDAAHRRARRAGHELGRPAADVADDHRPGHDAARAPALPRDHRRGLPDRDPDRPGRRRTHHRLLGMVLGLLDQHPVRPRRPRASPSSRFRTSSRPGDAASTSPDRSPSRRRSSRSCSRSPGSAIARHGGGIRRRLRRLGDGVRRLLPDRTAHRRADRAAAPLPQPHHRGGHGAVGDHRHRALLDHRLPAHLLPDGVPDERDRLGSRPDRDRVRDAGQQPRDRVARQSHRPLPGVRDRRHGARRRRPARDVAAARRGAAVGADDRHGRRRHRHGCVHEPHRRRRAERRAAAARRAPSRRPINLVRQVGSTVATAIIGGVIAVGVAALLPAGLDASTLTPQSVHAASPAVQAAGRRRSTAACSRPSSSRSPSSTRSASSPRSCCPAGRLSDEHGPRPPPQPSSETVTA